MLAYRARYVFPDRRPAATRRRGGNRSRSHRRRRRKLFTGNSRSPASGPRFGRRGDFAGLDQFTHAFGIQRFCNRWRFPVLRFQIGFDTSVKYQRDRRQQMIAGNNPEAPRQLALKNQQWSGVTAIGDVESGNNSAQNRFGVPYFEPVAAYPSELMVFIELISLKSGFFDDASKYYQRFL